MIDKEGPWRPALNLTSGRSPTVPAPPPGLRGASNYFLYSNCDPLLDVSVKIAVTEDIVCESTSGGPEVGFSFQVNGYSPPDETTVWQQYVILLLDSELRGDVDNYFEPSGMAAKSRIFERNPATLASVPRAKTLPKGYQLEISLRNNVKWTTSWDLAVTGGWAGPGDGGLLLYDRAAGVGACYAIDRQVWLDLLQDEAAWRPSWDLAVTGGWAAPGEGGLLLYDRAAGLAAFYAVNKQGEIGPPLHEEETRSSWDLAVTGGWAGPGESGLLLYDRAAGVGAFYAINDHGEMHLLQQYETWRTSWDLAVTGGWAGPGESGLLLYDRAAGIGAFYAINGQGEMRLVQQYDDSITGVTFEVTDDHGQMVATDTKRLDSISGITAGDLSPIVAFTFNLVGPGGGEDAVLSSGAGTIAYSAATPLAVLTYEPPCAEFRRPTGEEANSVYGQLPVGEAGRFTQSFTVTDAPPAPSPFVTRRPRGAKPGS